MIENPRIDTMYILTSAEGQKEQTNQEKHMKIKVKSKITYVIPNSIPHIVKKMRNEYKSNIPEFCMYKSQSIRSFLQAWMNVNLNPTFWRWCIKHHI